jgi:hypothetical protein
LIDRAIGRDAEVTDRALMFRWAACAGPLAMMGPPRAISARFGVSAMFWSRARRRLMRRLLDRNIATMVAVVLLGQVMAGVMLQVLVLRPQSERIADVTAE